MTQELHTQVLVVGAGPAGLVVAMDLARRGVDVLLVEREPLDAVPSPRCNHISARSMEVFRQFGLAAGLRAVGLPDDYPSDVSFVTRLTGHELARLPIASRHDRLRGSPGSIDAGWPTPEPAHRCNQMYFQPVMRRHASTYPGLRHRFLTEIDGFVQHEGHVAASGRDLASGDALHITAQYVVGCDGGRSAFRKKIGARFNGVDVISRNRMMLIRAPELLQRLAARPAWMTWFMNRDTHGTVHAIDGRELWAFSFNLPEGMTDFEQFDRERALRAAIGADVPYEVVHTEDWFGRRLVADKLRDRRVFICGDAAHIWIPMAGYGMNAGIADAFTLAWQLAAVVQGWAEPGLLDAYERERLPVTEQVSTFAMGLATKNYGSDLRRNPPPALEQAGAEGDRVRAEARDFLVEANQGQFNCVGLNFGAYYLDSPIVAYDATPPPAYGLDRYTPSTVPGCRTPHLWLRDGSSLYDRFGPGYTLLRFDAATEVAPLLAAAAARAVPLTVLDVDAPEAAAVYDRKLVLSRPDHYVAWRGDTVPGDPLHLIDTLRGAGSPTPSLHPTVLPPTPAQHTAPAGATALQEP